MSEEINVGLIGCGGIGKLRAEALASASGIRLAAVSDVDGARRDELAAAHGARSVTTWDDLLVADDVDVVVVSTPPSLHAEMSIAALGAGKHVLCEKPLARSPGECRDMVEAASRNERVLATGFNYRFYPSMLKARELLDAGAIGELDHIRSYTGYSAAEHDQAWLHDHGIMGGGSLRDNGIHLIDLTCWFLGDVAEAKGLGSNHVWGFPGCEDNGFVLLQNEAGKIASLQASWTEWRGYRLMVEIFGTRGCIRATCFPMITEVMQTEELGRNPRKKRHWFPYSNVMEHLRSYRWVVVQSFVKELEAFAAATRGEETALATGHDGLVTIEVAAAGGLAPGADASAPAEPSGAAAEGSA